jgi:hypothetical protein
VRWFITRFSFPLGFAFVALVCLAASFSAARAGDYADWAVALAAVGGGLFALIGVACIEPRREQQAAESADDSSSEA